MTKRRYFKFIGARAVDRLFEHLQTLGHNTTIYNGSYGQPDLISLNNAIEVKHVKYQYNTTKKDRRYKQHGYLKYFKESWFRLCEWCKENNYVPQVIVVTELPKEGRLFIRLTEEQVNIYIALHPNSKWMNVDIRTVVKEGEKL